MSSALVNPPQTLPNTRTREQWAAVINADWRKSIDSIIQTGRDIAAAKGELPHGEFLAMIEADLPFGERMARNLMDIAAHPIIGDRNRGSDLPTSWTVLRTLTKLDESDFAWAEQRGLIQPGMSRGAAVAVVQARKTNLETLPGHKTDLPKPEEARKIAKETGRFVAASDGNVYTGADKEKSDDYALRRTEAFRVLEAITTLANARDGKTLAENLEQHWLHEFRIGSVDDAVAFLDGFLAGLGVVNA